MEKKVLGWLNQTQLMQQFGDYIEVDPQYPIGLPIRLRQGELGRS
jgi:hypothetical protein